MHHFVTEMYTCAHIFVTRWFFVRYGTGVLWDLWWIYYGVDQSAVTRQKIVINLSQLNVISPRRCQEAVALGYLKIESGHFTNYWRLWFNENSRCSCPNLTFVTKKPLNCSNAQLKKVRRLCFIQQLMFISATLWWLFNSLGPNDAYMRQWTNHHYLNQCCNIVNSNPRNKLQGNLKRNSFIFIQKIAFENAVCEMVANLFWLLCDNSSVPSVMYICVRKLWHRWLYKWPVEL